jgi:hypothetical protein
MRSRDLENYRLFRSDMDPGIGFLIPEDEPVPADLRGPSWAPVAVARLPRVPRAGDRRLHEPREARRADPEAVTPVREGWSPLPA